MIISNDQTQTITDDDLPKVVSTYIKVFSNEGEQWTEESALKHIKQNYQKDSSWIVKQEDQVVGFCFAILQTREKGDELYIDSIGVLPEYQHKGIGKILLDRAEKYAAEKQVSELRLAANPDWESFGWYKKHSFNKTGWVDMFKELD